MNLQKKDNIYNINVDKIIKIKYKVSISFLKN